jgi:hypothetical protein
MALQQDLHTTVALLARVPGSLDALLRGLPETWTHANEGEKTWNAFDVLGHLVNLERRHWISRVKLVLQDGEPQPFPPVDRFSQMRDNGGRTLGQLLDEFARLRAENLAALEALNLNPDDLTRQGLHPALGPVTLSQLLATWVNHDLTHLHQLSRILADQYREAVGPWSAYLGVLKCEAHGD